MEPVHDLVIPSRNGARPRRVLLIVATALALTGGLATQHVSAAPTAMSFLNEARDFSAKHESATFSGLMTMTFAENESGLGSRTTSKARITGEVDDDRMRMVIDHGEGAEEMIIIGKTMYMRSAESTILLVAEEFAKESLASPGIVSGSPAETNQFDLDKMLGAASKPVVSKLDDGRVTMTVRLDPKTIDPEFAEHVKSFEIRFVVLDNGQVESMTQTWKGPAFDGEIALNFSDWDTPVKVAEPTAAQVDPTPDFDEAKIANYRDSTLVMPRVIPSGWEMTYADLITAEESDEDCAQVSVDFDDMTDESDDALYAYTYLLPADCVEEVGGKAFQAGPYSGYIDTDKDGSWVELRIDATSVLEIDTNLPPADIARIFGDLVALELSKGPTAAGPSI